MSDFYSKDSRPNDEIEYGVWFSEKFTFRENEYAMYYEQVTNNMRKQFCDSVFWATLKESIKGWDDEFYSEKGVHLFTKDDTPEVVIKPLKSLLNKTYRKNVLKNDSFPNKPDNGWVTHNNWFDVVHDIIRTSFEVKYLDGVKFLESKLKDLSEKTGMTDSYRSSFEARDDGYYAVHAAIRLPLNLITRNWELEEHIIEIEIQITTELQEMIKMLLHKYYEKNRINNAPKDYKWQWDYDSEQFIPNYMGHIAHYIEGMIVEIREKKQINK